MRRLAAGALAVLVAGALGIAAAPAGAAPATGPRKGAVAPLHVVAFSPRPGATRVDGAAPIVVTFSEPLATSTPLPSWSVGVPGRWRRVGRRLVFHPSAALPPERRFTLTVPGGPGGARAASGATLRREQSATFTTGSGGLLGAQVLLSALHYLPAHFVPAAPPAGPKAAVAHVPLGPGGLLRAAYRPPEGRLVPDAWDPAPLRSLVRPGVDNVATTGAIESFQRVHHLPLTGRLDAVTWRLLGAAAASPARNGQPGGYTYALADQQQPETLTVYAGGSVVVHTLANTGITASPTADGSFLVYERLASQVMSGTTPWGSHYADPVAWVAYFNGGDAVHYIGRAAYGYPQSLGCIEAPYAAARRAWSHLQLGTVVTVEG